MTLTFGSLFAGIGGIDLGLERAGMRCEWQVENNDYCNRVLAKHWPNVPRFQDVRGVGAHNLPYADVIAGGFPCQDISEAGTSAGLAGSRSGLWFEFQRIIRELRPRYVLVENVSALLTRGMGTILGGLAEIGYDTEWTSLSAAHVGAPHLRERIFVVAYPTGVGLDRSVFQSARTCRTRLEKARRSNAHCWGTARRGVGGRVLIVPDTRDNRKPARVPAVMDRLRGLGNAVVPQVAEFVGQQIVAFDEAMS